MGLFSNLMEKVFGRKPEDGTQADQTTDAPAGDAAAEPTPSPLPEAAGESAPSPLSEVDVEAVLTELAEANSEDLDWRHSIVDLMKLVGMESSYDNRKKLALELGYSQEDIEGKGSAEMNIWLHKEVMRRFAENGGKVPSDLLG